MGVEAMDDGWQPIETAPRDDRIIIGGWNFNGGTVESEMWEWDTDTVWAEGDVWASDVCDCGYTLPTTIEVIVAWRPESGPPDWAKMPPNPDALDTTKDKA